MLAIVLLFLAFAIALTIWIFHSGDKNAPPGPPALPFVGNLFSFGERPHYTMLEWRKKYGDTFSYLLGRERVVVINNLETARKVFSDDAASGRDPNFLVRKLFKGYGLVWSQGEIWKEHRRFALSALRDFGMGKTWLEDAVIDEVDEMCNIFADYHGKPVDPKEIISHSVSNVICALVFGERFNHSNKDFTRLTTLMSELISLFRIDPVLQVFPFLKYVPGPYRTHYRRLENNLEELKEVFSEQIVKHNKEFVPGAGDAKDFIDAYFQEAKSQGEKETTFDHSQLLYSLIDLFGAGTDTTATSLSWSLVVMLENPKVLRKVQAEIDGVVGRDTPVRMDNKSLLPYTEATILEIQRFTTILPLLVTHSAVREITVDGFILPAGTLLATNVHSIHHDTRYWKSPETFDPTRFLDDQGKVTKPEGFLPFSVGKRACLGEGLAKMELYLFFANMFRRFDMKLPPGKTISHEEYVFSLIIGPNPFEVIFTPRS